ncbi:MAG: metallophosphoesterase family protein [Acidobacteria bacterium]|nr:metallophosphoesterase family protein [Acidobacteriota bacterium]
MKMSRIRTALLLLFAFTFVQTSGALGQSSAAAATPEPDQIRLTWTGDPATTMTITWRTDATVASGLVQYQEGNSINSNAREMQARAQDFKTDLGTTRLFSATLAGLSPNTRFSYRVGDGKRWSGILSFKTADPDAKTFKFLVFGDSQSPVTGGDPYGEWRETVQNAYKANPDASFFVNVGDLVDFGQIGAHWDAWFAAVKGVIDAIPAMPLPGNHESYGSRDTWKPEFFTAQFVLPRNGPVGLKEQAYSYDFGPVHFVVLDSQAEEQRRYGDILSIQQSWLESDLTTSRKEWKIAFFHRAPYGVKPDRDEKEVRNAFCPILERNRVGLVFTAHDHGIKRTFPIKNGVAVKDPSEGTIYYVTGRSGSKTYDDIEEKELSAFFHAPFDQPNYFVVEGTDTKITVKTVLRDGAVIDTLTLDKPKANTFMGAPVQF